MATMQYPIVLNSKICGQHVQSTGDNLTLHSTASQTSNSDFTNELRNLSYFTTTLHQVGPMEDDYPYGFY